MKSSSTLIADIGGTNARFALSQRGEITTDVSVLSCLDYPDLATVTSAFLETLPQTEHPRFATFAVAAPVKGDTIQFTNLGWSFSVEALRRDLGLETLNVINDFTAIAWAVPRLQADQRRQIGGGAPVPNAPIAILGPGSGLGVAALIPTDDGWTVLATEGGHATMAAATVEQDRVLETLRHTFGHVSIERVLSGPGLLNIYTALTGMKEENQVHLSPEEISSRAIAHPGTPAATALDLFFDFLGTAAADAALAYDARGGVYLAGGILGKLECAMENSTFRQRFESKGRFKDFVSRIPTYVLSHPFPALAGLARGPLGKTPLQSD